jgi:hypothetical protein
MSESAKNIINLLILHLISIFSFILLGVAVAFLYPIGYFDHALSYLWMLSGIGILFIYKRPDITKKLFLITVLGSVLTILLYILTTSQDWTIFWFIYILFSIPCILLFTLAVNFLE